MLISLIQISLYNEKIHNDTPRAIPEFRRDVPVLRDAQFASDFVIEEAIQSLDVIYNEVSARYARDSNRSMVWATRNSRPSSKLFHWAKTLLTLYNASNEKKNPTSRASLYYQGRPKEIQDVTAAGLSLTSREINSNEFGVMNVEFYDIEIGWAQEYRVEMCITPNLIAFNRDSVFFSVLFEIIVTAAESHTTKDLHITCGDESIGLNKTRRDQCLDNEMKDSQGYTATLSGCVRSSKLR